MIVVFQMISKLSIFLPKENITYLLFLFTRMEYLFQFNDKFEINDDQEVLKSIGMLMGNKS